MFAIEVKVPDIPLLNGTAQAVVDEELRSYMGGAVLAVKGRILPLVPVNTGALRGSVISTVVGHGVDITGGVFTTLPYALAVENGSKPHFPPYQPGSGLYRWVELKLGSDDVARTAFLVARAIAQRGTKAVHFFRDGIEAARPQVLSLWAATAKRIAHRLMSR